MKRGHCVDMSYFVLEFFTIIVDTYKHTYLHMGKQTMTHGSTEQQWRDITNFDFSKGRSSALGSTAPELGMTIAKDPRIESGEFKTDLIRITPESDFGGNNNIFAIDRDHCTILKYDVEPRQFYLRHRHGIGGPSSLAAMLAYDREHELAKNRILVQVGPKTEDHKKSHFEGDPIIFPEGTTLWAVLRNIYEDFTDRPEECQQDANPCDTDDPDF